MKNMEREKFEESFRHAFDRAEVTPSDNVWTNIELELEKEKGSDLKKRLFFYQMVAAASVVFALAIGGYGLYQFGNPRNTIAQQGPVNTADPAAAATPGLPAEESPATDAGTSLKEIPAHATDVQAGVDATRAREADAPLRSGGNLSALALSRAESEKISSPDRSVPAAVDARDEHFATAGAITFDDRRLPPLYHPRKIDLMFASPVKEVDPVVAMMAMLERREREVNGEEKKEEKNSLRDENLWTSVGFSAGSFNTQSGSVSPTASNAMVASNTAIVNNEANASGMTYSMGVNVGTKLSDRWVFQGGVNYLTNSSDYTSTSAVAMNPQYQSFRPASTNELVKADAQQVEEAIVYTAPYNINNSLRYLSIPMQAGYLLVNKSFGLQLNAGVATDLFLQNTVKADGDNMDKTTQSSGSDSPYRTVNLSGLVGTEVSYRFGKNYRIALNPGLRYPLNTIYKTDLGVQASPLTFDVGLRFRYIFH